MATEPFLPGPQRYRGPHPAYFDERRAEAAVIAWMRHQTTSYDSMKIAGVKGQRREIRRLLAQRSKELLQGYRSGEPAAATCPLAQALACNESAAGQLLDKSTAG